MFYHQFDPIDFSFCRFNNPKMYTKWFYTSFSWFTGPNGAEMPLCYSTEAWKMAQTAFFIAIIEMQYANIFICKTRSLSIGQQGILNNKWILFGMFTELLVGLAVAYVPPFNVALQS